MTERSDLTTFWEEDPRIIEIADPSTEIIIQDLHDTLKSNTEQASENDDSLLPMDDDPIIDSQGKANLGGGDFTGITATMLDSQLAFESRLTPASEGTITTINLAGDTLIDSGADFVADGVQRGDVVINFTDESITEVLSRDTDMQLTTRVLRAGTNDDYEVADVYKIWNIIQCTVSGGNLVGVDELDAEQSPIFPTAFTQIILARATSPTLVNADVAAFWDALTADHAVVSSFGEKVGRKLLTLATWIALK